MSKLIAIVDYGIGNVFNIVRACEQCGVEAQLVDSVAQIQSASHIILPGVGAFGKGMHELETRGFVDAIKLHATKQKPLLGICLGMQLLLDESDEFGKTKGLGIIPGKVIAIPSTGSNGKLHKIPHIGWNELKKTASGSDWSESILYDVKEDVSTYFVHSFTAFPNSAKHRLADVDYDGCQISAVIQDGNIYGCQFHPEKSGSEGLKILKAFLEI